MLSHVRFLSPLLASFVALGCSTGASSSTDGAASAAISSTSTPRTPTASAARSAEGKSAPAASSSGAPRPTVSGKLLRAPLLDGYESVGAGDPDAKEAVESGGVFLREKGKKSGAVVGALAMAGLPIDPSLPD